MLLLAIHISCAVITIVGFNLRGVWMFVGSRYLQLRWVKIAPHIIDTVLLLSAVGLMLKIEQYPVVDDWLSAKVVGLVAYILLGIISLRGSSKSVRVVAWLGANAAFFYIVSVALTRQADFGLL
ncbi:MAG: SirB2 family protein [Gammaproteobacteria bacterium]|nr:SirB2 family protein [Gammaproteobacteria bacterium]